MAVESWLERHLGEASGRHLRGIWEASERHLGGILGIRGREESWRENVPKSRCFTVFELATPCFV